MSSESRPEEGLDSGLRRNDGKGDLSSYEFRLEGQWVNPGRKKSPEIKVHGLLVALEYAGGEPPTVPTMGDPDLPPTETWTTGDVLCREPSPRYPVKPVRVPAGQMLAATYHAAPPSIKPWKIPSYMLLGVDVKATLLVKVGRRLGSIVLPVARLIHL